MSNTEGQPIKAEVTVNQDGKSEGAVCGFAALPGLEFRSKTVFAKCTIDGCGHTGPTVVESTWNLKSCLCCYYYGGYWKCWNLLRGNDWTAKNGIHRCGKCNKSLMNYQAC
jgi:hypothetical protein